MSSSSGPSMRAPAKSQMTVRSLNSEWKASAVVDAPHVPLGVDQAVAALAIGVVREQVEAAKAPELRDDLRVVVARSS